MGAKAQIQPNAVGLSYTPTKRIGASRITSGASVSKPTTAIPAIAIDVGFFSTKFTTGARDNAGNVVVRLFPSVAPRVSNSMMKAVKSDNLDGVVIEVSDGVRHFVGRDAQNLMTTSGSRAVTADYSKSSDYQALFLGALHQIAKESHSTGKLCIDTLVAGLPMSTVYTHAAPLQAYLVGTHRIPDPRGPDLPLEVEIKNAMVIAQPHGALISHGVTKASGSQDITLVLDMGGGTFDWFVAKGITPNRALCGAAPIGALACAAAVCDEIKLGLKDNPEVIARVDNALREGLPSVQITGTRYDMDGFMPVVNRVLQDGIEQMLKSVGSLDAMDHILITGGGAKLLWAALQRALPQYTGVMAIDSEPIASNVRGFHALAMHQARAR